MKKRLLVLLPAFLFSLTACNLGNLISNIQKDSDDETSHNSDDHSNDNGGEKSSNQGEDYDDSIFDKPASIEKLMALGEETGFEIMTHATDVDGADYIVTFGMKGNVWWLIDGDGSGIGYRLEEDRCAMLSYDSEEGQWSVLIPNAGETQFAEMFASSADYLYSANQYFANDGFTKQSEGKYAGRDVLKFKYHYGIASVTLDHDYYVDKDIGLTLYHYATTTNDGETNWAKIETTSFKTGDDVDVIEIVA